MRELLFKIKNNQVTLIDTHKGLTNKNYYLNDHDNEYMVRIPYPNSEHIVSYINEEKAIKAIASHDIDVPCLYYDAKTGLKISQYLNNTTCFQDCNYVNKIEMVAKLLRKFHDLKIKINSSFDYIEKFNTYKNHTSNMPYEFPYLDKVLSEVCKVKRDYVLCHNDVVDGNLLFVNERLYLIDFEYACDNDPYFDVISFLSENEIYDESLRKRFYDVYFDHYDENTLADLRYLELYADALWCHWAIMMYEARQQQIYLDIAKSKYDAYCKLIKIT